MPYIYSVCVSCMNIHACKHQYERKWKSEYAHRTASGHAIFFAIILTYDGLLCIPCMMMCLVFCIGMCCCFCAQAARYSSGLSAYGIYCTVDARMQRQPQWQSNIAESLPDVNMKYVILVAVRQSRDMNIDISFVFWTFDEFPFTGNTFTHSQSKRDAQKSHKAKLINNNEEHRVSSANEAINEPFKVTKKIVSY